MYSCGSIRRFERWLLVVKLKVWGCFVVCCVKGNATNDATEDGSDEMGNDAFSLIVDGRWRWFLAQCMWL
jgi:hypothetical protein